MFRPKRPMSGRLVFLAALSSLAMSGLAACAKKESEDSWRMTPPTFELIDSKEGKIQRLEYSKVKTGLEPLIANDTAVLRFAAADSGLAMKIKSECESGPEKSGEYAASLITTDSLSILMLVPPTILHPEALKKEWNCSLKAQVMNANGSTQAFAINNFKLNLIPLNQRMDTAAVKHLSDGRDGLSRFTRRMMCPSWWSDVAPGESLETVTRPEKLNGKDTRETERQPLCSVLELSPRPQIVRFFRPNFGAPDLSWTTENLITASGTGAILHRPLLAWNIRNDSANLQVGFIALPASSVRVSVLAMYPSQAATWSKPNSVRPTFTVEGAASRITSKGLYFDVPAKKSVRVTMTSNYEHTTCPFNTMIVLNVLLRSENPVKLLTLANTAQFTTIATADPAALDASPRDVQNPTAQDLLSTLILKTTAGTDLLALTDMTLDQATTLGREVGYACIHGDFIPPINIDSISQPVPVTD